MLAVLRSVLGYERDLAGNIFLCCRHQAIELEVETRYIFVSLEILVELAGLEGTR